MTKLIKDKNFFQITCEKKSIVELENGGIQIEGYASTKDKDRGSDIVEPTAFKNAVAEYMTNPIVLLQHNAEKPVGIVTDATIDSKGLYIKANITEDEDGIFSKLKNGVIRAFSIGYRVKDFEDVKTAEGFETVIKDLELFEISLVSIPMNQYALMKSMQDCFENEVEESNEVEEVEAVAEETDEHDAEDFEKEIEEATENEEKESENTSSDSEQNVEIEEKELEVEQEPVDEEKDVENVEPQQADEQSEIENSENSDESENVVETTTDEETIVETHEETIVEKAVNLKELSKKSMEMFIDGKFESMQKAFEEKIQQKDMEIESLKKNFNKQTEILAKFAECLDEMDQKMKTTIVSGYAFQKADKPRTAYGNIVSNLKNL